MGFARFLLRFSILIPLLVWGAVAAVGYLTPGYDPMTQYVSELGASGPYAQYFNWALMGAGGVAVLVAVGFMLAAGMLARHWLFSPLAAILFGAWGVALVLMGLHPLPSAQHLLPLFSTPWGTATLDMLVVLAPLALWLALGGAKQLLGTKFLLLVAFLGSAALLAIGMGAFGLSTTATAGLWQRGYLALVSLWPFLVASGLSGRMVAKAKADRRRAQLAAQAAADSHHHAVEASVAPGHGHDTGHDTGHGDSHGAGHDHHGGHGVALATAAGAAAAVAAAAHHGHSDHGHGDHGHGHDDHGHDAHGHEAGGHDAHAHGHGHDEVSKVSDGHDDHGHGDHGHDDHGHGAPAHGAHDDHGHGAPAHAHEAHGHDDHGHSDHGHGDHGHGDHGHDPHPPAGHH